MHMGTIIWSLSRDFQFFLQLLSFYQREENYPQRCISRFFLYHNVIVIVIFGKCSVSLFDGVFAKFSVSKSRVYGTRFCEPLIVGQQERQEHQL